MTAVRSRSGHLHADMTEDLGEVGALVYRELVGVLRTEVRLDGRNFGIADALSTGDGRAAVQAGEDVCHGPSRSPPETTSRKPRPSRFGIIQSRTMTHGWRPAQSCVRASCAATVS